MTMEPTGEKNTPENFLKIDTVWSEAEENLVIKEEIVSDMEPDFIASTNENSSDFYHNSNSSKPTGEKENHNGNFNNELLTSWQAFKKKIKTKCPNALSDELDMKASCSHDTKNFKIVKRRLRCGDCRSLVCPECCKIMTSTLQNHFLGSDSSSNGSHLCKLCNIPFNSLCALQAHIRIHTMDTPYVCPDCGLMYNNIYFLILHLINKCYHVYKIVRYKCKNCPGTYFTSETFVQHIQQLHMESIFRCLYCSSLFSNSQEFAQHMETTHQKQKVQYLNYFKCLLCSNMVIPRFMYQKHIAQHYESPEAFEVSYQCLCDKIYSLVGAFRAHNQQCKEKGVLPPYWSFLQRNLKHYELPRNEHQQTKDTPSKCSNNLELEAKKLSMIRASDENSVVKSDNEKFTNCELMKNKCFKFDEKKSGSKNSGNEEVSIVREESGKESDLLKASVQSNPPNILQSSESPKSSTEQHLNKTDYHEMENSLKLSETPNIQLEVEYPRDVNLENLTFDKNENQIPEEVKTLSKVFCLNLSKVFYDHIPRDHLGYVIKTQCPESGKKDSPVSEPLVLDKKLSPQDYHIVTELNEKTGLITTRKVPLEHVEDEEEEMEIENEKSNDTKEDVDDVHSPQVGPKLYGMDKSKFKLGNSLFTCPFCVVLFPKHSATFQQFRLHLESYHPDAALNITVNREETNKEPDKTGTLTEDKCVDSENLENAESETKNGGHNEDSDKQLPDQEDPNSQSSKKSPGPKKQTEEDSQSDLESCKDNCCRESKDVAGGSSNAMGNTGNDKTETEISIIESGDQERTGEQNQLPSEGKNVNTENKDNPDDTENDCIAIYESSKDKNVVKEETNCELADEQKGKEPERLHNTTDGSNSQSDENDTTGGSVTIIEDGVEEEKYVDTGKEEKVIPEKEIKDDDKCKKENVESSERNSVRVPSDFEDECDTSNHSNWSAGSVIEYVSGKDSKDSSLESKPEDKERSRRESEVWSEFYESLMMAEKLKKKKKPQSHSEGKKKSVVSDYSAKRVVKKPKRYRESSDSEDSAGGNENSDSDPEFQVSNDFVSTVSGEEKDEAEGSVPNDQLLKKQKLMQKLQNVDSSFVDYLYDLVNKKEKYFELYKKHSTLRANRYSQDLRSYRKKVLNGIKHRGRPHKVLKYQELLKKKEPTQLSAEKNTKEMSFQRTPKKDGTVENKSGERKRGRPRKIVDSAKLKERRRSDKEVDFIEKNFEREENDMSPSKRKRKLSSKLQYYKKINLTDDKEDFSSGQVICNRPVDSSKKFACAVCKEVFPEVSEFREHILAHRMEENSYQCMECGECFVVRPSLEKHLHAFHKVKNTDKYIKDNGCCNIKKETVEAEVEPLKENQCKVCKDQFERAIDLTKHFRIHGMAFLKEFKGKGK